MTTRMCNLGRTVGSTYVKKFGRPYVYKDREVICISLPRKAKAKANELRGKQPLATFITEQICEKLGIDDIYA